MSQWFCTCFHNTGDVARCVNACATQCVCSMTQKTRWIFMISFAFLIRSVRSVINLLVFPLGICVFWGVVREFWVPRKRLVDFQSDKYHCATHNPADTIFIFTTCWRMGGWPTQTEHTDPMMNRDPALTSTTSFETSQFLKKPYIAPSALSA